MAFGFFNVFFVAFHFLYLAYIFFRSNSVDFYKLIGKIILGRKTDGFCKISYVSFIGFNPLRLTKTYNPNHILIKSGWFGFTFYLNVETGGYWRKDLSKYANVNWF